MMIPNIAVVFLWLLCKDMACLSQGEAQVKVDLLFVVIFLLLFVCFDFFVTFVDALETT